MGQSQSRTYKATGINLKGQPMGEYDRLLTILTKEYGLMRAIAPGARKHHSKLSGRSGLFVTNQLLIVKGKSLDKVIQAETLYSYPGLSQDLSKLTAGQYLAELVLCQALSEQPQSELFELLATHLQKLENAQADETLLHMLYGTFQLLEIAGIAPRLDTCCMTQQVVQPNFQDPEWRIGFSAPAGGTVLLSALQSNRPQLSKNKQAEQHVRSPLAGESVNFRYGNRSSRKKDKLDWSTQITAPELVFLQKLALASINQVNPNFIPNASPAFSQCSTERQLWRRIELVLRHYAQYHFEMPIRSGDLIDACFKT